MQALCRRNAPARVRCTQSHRLLSTTPDGEASRTGAKAGLPCGTIGRRDFAPPPPTRPTTDPIAMADSKPRHDDSATGGWSGRFGEPVADRVKRYTASVDFDRRLADADIAGSLAHARMLAAVGVLAADDLAAIERGMETIRGEIARGEFSWSRDLEDVHFNIEKRLTALVGDAGKRLHTGRSRNDQVATDLRLWLRAEIDGLVARIGALRRGLHRPRGAACRHDHARLHAPAGRAARHLRSPSARLRGDVRPRRRAAPRLPPARQPAAAGKRRARRDELSDRPRAWSRRSWASRRFAATRSTPYPIAISPSSSPPPPRSR